METSIEAIEAILEEAREWTADLTLTEVDGHGLLPDDFYKSTTTPTRNDKL